jgi:hypothetical protein
MVSKADFISQDLHVHLMSNTTTECEAHFTRQGLPEVEINSKDEETNSSVDITPTHGGFINSIAMESEQSNERNYESNEQIYESNEQID